MITEEIWTCPNIDCDNNCTEFDNNDDNKYCPRCGTKLAVVEIGYEAE